jgi:hypothetical protein
MCIHTYVHMYFFNESPKVSHKKAYVLNLMLLKTGRFNTRYQEGLGVAFGVDYITATSLLAISRYLKYNCRPSPQQ